MPKFYIQIGTFRTTISRPALIGTFNKLEQETKRQTLGKLIMVDQRGFVYDLLSPDKYNHLLEADYLKNRRDNCREIKLLNFSTGFLSCMNETLFFHTEDVVKMVNRLNGSK